MRYTISLDCKTNHVRKDGTFPILIRVSLNGKHHYINTGRRIKETQYDKGKKTVKSGVKGSSSLTSFINRHKVIIEDIISDFDKKGEIPTILKIKDVYEQETGKKKTKYFSDFVEEQIRWEHKNTQIKKTTLKNYEFQLQKLKNYNSKLSIHDINEKFLDEYKSYVVNTLGQSKNSGYHAMCFLRKYTRMLFQDNMISPYPFAKYKVGSPFEAEIEFLEIDELNKLHDLYESKELLKIIRKYKTKYTKDFNTGERYQEVLRYFLLACYTGLRHSDVKTLRTQHIKGEFIVKEMIKGREGRTKIVRVPIRKRLLSLINQDNTTEFIFDNPVLEDNQTNKYLKAIMGIAKIDKHITFHCARHTFAVISLLLGVSIQVVSDILGHSELKTTQRYAKVVDEQRNNEMDNWDKLAKVEFKKENYLDVYCSSCGNLVLTLKKFVINLDILPCECDSCNFKFDFPLKKREMSNPNKMQIAS